MNETGDLETSQVARAGGALRLGDDNEPPAPGRHEKHRAPHGWNFSGANAASAAIDSGCTAGVTGGGEMRRLVLLHLWKIETVARRFGVHHSTVKRVLRDALVGELPPIPKSVIDDFKPRIIERITDAPEFSAVRLLEELRQQGHKDGIATLRRYVAQVRQPRARKVYVRVEMKPGEQAQVDWGHFGHLRIGNSQRPLSAFAMMMSYSRALYVDFSLDQRLETFLLMHRRALDRNAALLSDRLHPERVTHVP